MIYESIKKLVQYGIDTGLTPESERIYTTNLLLDLMQEDEYEDVDETSGSNSENSGSDSYTEIIAQKVGQILSAQGFPCIFCHKSVYKLLPLSHDCKEELFVSGKAEMRYLLIISCQQKNAELFRFKITLRKGVKE